MKKLTIKKMQERAEKRGGKCISVKYINTNTKLLWECSEGHRWVATPENIKAGRWCRKCSILQWAEKRKLTIGDMRKKAMQKGGKCLSEKYINTHTKLLWECSEGHRWEAVPSSIKQGTWCPRCSGTYPLNLQAMQKMAEERGGKCLSEKYINTHTKLLWECSAHHQWETTPNNIRAGQWCPYCGKKNHKI
jgi:hypothetical protein